MGWVAIIGGTIITIMFIYNWMSKGNSPTLADRTSSTEHAPTHIDDEKPGEIQNGRAVPRPIVQPPNIVDDSHSVQTKSRDDQEDIETSRPFKPSDVTIMAPPPPPTIASTTALMGPPRSKSPPRLKPPTIGRAPATAPPRPSGGTLRPPPSAASSLRVPQTKVLSNTHMAPSSLMGPPQQKASRQVTLKPGHSPLDWAALTSNPKNNLRGQDAPDHFIRVTQSMLRAQNGRKGKDAWTVYQGKVYNITPYLPFHPGGEGELKRGAGKDSGKLFMEVHPWVNWDGMLSECCVGIFVGENEGENSNTHNQLDEMD